MFVARRAPFSANCNCSFSLSVSSRWLAVFCSVAMVFCLSARRSLASAISLVAFSFSKLDLKSALDLNIAIHFCVSSFSTDSAAFSFPSPFTSVGGATLPGILLIVSFIAELAFSPAVFVASSPLGILANISSALGSLPAVSSALADMLGILPIMSFMNSDNLPSGTTASLPCNVAGALVPKFSNQSPVASFDPPARWAPGGLFGSNLPVGTGAAPAGGALAGGALAGGAPGGLFGSSSLGFFSFLSSPINFLISVTPFSTELTIVPIPSPNCFAAVLKGTCFPIIASNNLLSGSNAPGIFASRVSNPLSAAAAAAELSDNRC